MECGLIRNLLAIVTFNIKDNSHFNYKFMAKQKTLISRCFKVDIILKPDYQPENRNRVVRVVYLHGTLSSVMEEAKTILEDNQQIGIIKEEPNFHAYEE